jgi:hypothetical protein
MSAEQPQDPRRFSSRFRQRTHPTVGAPYLHFRPTFRPQTRWALNVGPIQTEPLPTFCERGTAVRYAQPASLDRYLLAFASVSKRHLWDGVAPTTVAVVHHCFVIAAKRCSRLGATGSHTSAVRRSREPLGRVAPTFMIASVRRQCSASCHLMLSSSSAWRSR